MSPATPPPPAAPAATASSPSRPTQRSLWRRIVRAPLLSLVLLGLWLLLNRSLSLGHIVLGAVLALAIPLLTAGLRPLPVRIRRPGAVLRLVLAVLADSLRSNLAVVRLLIWPARRRHPAGFVPVPLDVRDPNALAVLAMIICITPGSAWAEISLDRSMLLLHVLECDDPAAIAAEVKHRYERLLRQIFEADPPPV